MNKQLYYGNLPTQIYKLIVYLKNEVIHQAKNGWKQYFIKHARGQLMHDTDYHNHARE
jgi:hypothetical protein